MPIAERVPANTNRSKYYEPNGELIRTQDVELQQIGGNKEGERAQELGESLSTIKPHDGDLFSIFTVLSEYWTAMPVLLSPAHLIIPKTRLSPMIRVIQKIKSIDN